MAKVHHLVLVEFKQGVSEQQMDEAFSALSNLQSVIPGLENFKGGPYSSPEGLNQEFTHGFVMQFTDAASRDAYLPHPEHEKVKEQILPLVERVVAFDFEG